MKYSFFVRLSAVLAVIGALVFAVPVFAQSIDSTEKVSFFERIGLFFSARKERRLEKLKEFVAETIVEESTPAPVVAPEVFIPNTDPITAPVSLPTTPEIYDYAAPVSPEVQSLESMNQQSLFEFLAQ